MNTPLIVIVGPTGSGKSALAMKVARQHNGEIICADSRTVYIGADIGTAKPTELDRAKVPHYLLDVAQPNEQFTAAEFKRRAEEVITHIAKKEKLPVMVGGTGLYVDAVIFDYKFGEAYDPQRRATLANMGIEELQQICSDNNIDLPFNNKNKRHLIRAIEIGGLPKRKTNLRPNTLVVGIDVDKSSLRSRIEARAQAMVDQGVVDEVRALGEKYGWDAPAMSGNIYRIFKGVVENTKAIDDAVVEFIQSDMALAKRQLTWLKRNPHIVWGTPGTLEKVIAEFVRRSISS